MACPPGGRDAVAAVTSALPEWSRPHNPSGRRPWSWERPRANGFRISSNTRVNAAPRSPKPLNDGQPIRGDRLAPRKRTRGTVSERGSELASAAEKGRHQVEALAADPPPRVRRFVHAFIRR